MSKNTLSVSIKERMSVESYASLQNMASHMNGVRVVRASVQPMVKVPAPKVEPVMVPIVISAPVSPVQGIAPNVVSQPKVNSTLVQATTSVVHRSLPKRDNVYYEIGKHTAALAEVVKSPSRSGWKVLKMAISYIQQQRGKKSMSPGQYHLLQRQINRAKSVLVRERLQLLNIAKVSADSIRSASDPTTFRIRKEEAYHLKKTVLPQQDFYQVVLPAIIETAKSFRRENQAVAA